MPLRRLRQASIEVLRRAAGAARRDRRLVALAEAAAASQIEATAHLGQELRSIEAAIVRLEAAGDAWQPHLAPEVPYVFGALGGLAAGARVLDVGCAESTVAFSLASLGLEVTALDPRGYPLSHPRVRAVAAALEEWDSGSEMFDAVLFISSVEHFGLQGYSEGEVRSDADIRALERARSLLRPDGLLVVTVPFGMASVDGFQRVYDREGLDTLLAGWSVDDLVVIRRGDGAYWERVEEPLNVDPDRRYAALIRVSRGGKDAPGVRQPFK